MIKDGLDADQTNFNAAFVSRTADTSTTGKVSLNNTADTNSGAVVVNAQRAINETFDAVGITAEGDATRKAYSSTNVIANGDNHKTAIGKLDAGLITTPVAAARVTGTLPIANGGTGQTSKTLAYDALAPVTTEGDIVLRGTSASTRLPVGTDGQVLTVDSSVAGKVKWAVTSSANPNVSNASGTLPIANGGTGAANKTAAFNALSPLSTSGDLLGFDGTNDVRVPVGSQGQVLTVDTTTSTGLKWSAASGGAGYNYLPAGDFEAGVTIGATGVQYATATVTNGIPTGAPTLSNTANSITITTETSAPIRRTKSLRATGATNWTAGQGFSLGPVFALQPADNAKMLSVQLTYQPVSGQTTFNYSGSPGSQSLMIMIYDVTAGAWLPIPPGALGFNTINGTQLVTATFQISSVVGQQYQAFVFSGTTSTGPVAVLFDDVFIGRQPISYGSPISDATVYTMNVSATTTAPAKPTTRTADLATWRRVGDKCEITYNFAYNNVTGSTSGNGTYLFPLPTGMQIDTNKLSISNYPTAQTKCGYGRVLDSTNVGNIDVIAYNSTNLVCYMKYSAGGATGTSITDTGLGSGAFGFTDAAPYALSFTAVVPIAGWSSNVQMSSDTDTRVVNFQGYVATTTALTANTTPIPLSVSKDSHGSWSVNQYVVPVTGDYDFSGFLVTSAGGTVYAYVNGVIAASVFVNTSTTQNRYPISGTVVNVSAGSIITLRSDSNVNVVASANDRINISRKSGPSQIAATESVNATYYLSTGPSLGANTLIPYDGKYIDTHNAYSAGIWTCPVTGIYRLSAKGQSTTASTIYVKIAGTAAGYITSLSTNWNYGGSISRKIYAGQTVGFYTEAAQTLLTSATGGYLNEMSIERTGN